MERYKDDGIPYEVDSPSCNISTTIFVRRSKSAEDREIGRRFVPLWEALSTKLQEIFPARDAKGNFIVPSLDVRAEVLSLYDRRGGVGKPVFKHAPPGYDQLLEIAAPDLCEFRISYVVLRQIIREASTPAQNLATNV